MFMAATVKSEVRQNAWDEDFLRSIHSMDLVTAQREVIGLLEAGSTRDNKKAHLIRDIRRAKTSAEVSRIMYNAMLSGSGLGSLNSSWSKMYGSAK